MKITFALFFVETFIISMLHVTKLVKIKVKHGTTLYFTSELIIGPNKLERLSYQV
jgi:hypothetical protein